MKHLTNFFIGILIGCGAILPGVSSGVFCVIFGIYEKLINCICNFFKDIKNNISFLLPIASGTLIGIILFGNIIKYLFSQYEIFCRIAFVGLIIGTVPALFKQASLNASSNITIKKVIPIVFSFLIGITLILIEKFLPLNYTLEATDNISSYLYLILSGFLMSIGIVVPGISNTVILMCLGIYSKYISAIASINLQILIPMGIGILLGGFVFIKLIKYFLEKYHETTFYSIIGFTMGSVFVLLPNYNLFVNSINKNPALLLQCLLIFIISIIVSFKLEK